MKLSVVRNKRLVILLVIPVGILMLISIFFFLPNILKQEAYGQIAYIKYQDNTHPKIYVFDADGSHGRILNTGLFKNNFMWSSAPAWSPNGKYIAFGCSAGPNTSHENICLLHVDGAIFDTGEKVEFLINWDEAPDTFCSEINGKVGQFISWSSDGKKIAFTCSNSSKRQNLVCNIDLLTKDFSCWSLQPNININGISWSPIDDKLVLGYSYTNSEMGTVDNICIVTYDGENIACIANGYSPSWSPDGKKIAFIKDNSIFTINPDGSDLQAILKFIGDGSEIDSEEAWNDYWQNILFISKPSKITWSPDKQRIAFVATKSTSSPGSMSGIYVLEIWGGNIELLTIIGDGIFESPDWSPK